MPRKGENIYKRKDGRWEGRYIKSRTSTGKAIYGYVYAKTYREVKEKLIKAAFYKPKADYESPEKTPSVHPGGAVHRAHGSHLPHPGLGRFKDGVCP